MVVCVGEFGRSPQKAEHFQENAPMVGIIGLTLHRCHGRCGHQAGFVHGESDKTGSAPLDKPIHPRELLATIYHGFGIDPESIVYNHLNQPRELVKAQAVTELFA